MPGRNYSAGSEYRYGFNGKEKDKEVAGTTTYDYGFRIYSPGLGRFLSVDPLFAKYPFYTPYSFAGNKPIQCVDLDGAEESIPYLQASAFDLIATNLPGISYIRGKSGDKLATRLPQKEKGEFIQFLESMSPIYLAPIEPAAHIAQAINFGSSIGAVVYDYDSRLKGEYKSISNGYESLVSNKNTVYLNISGYSEVGQAIVQELRSCHGLKEMTDNELADYISSIKILFEPEKDYSSLFWKQDGRPNASEIMLIDIRPIAVPMPSPSVPILMPPFSGDAVSINTKNGAISVNVDAISKELANTLAPSILEMAHKKEQSQSSGSTKKGGAKATTHQKGQTHGSLSSKKGNKPNNNKRKGAENRGGKRN